MRFRLVGTFALSCWLCAALPVAAQARSVSLVWDRSPDPSAIGYVVYVGSVPGFPDESYDVSNDTSFEYQNVEPNRAYFFSVAAYAAPRVVGDRSDEVFFLAGSTLTAPSVMTAAPQSAAPVIASPMISQAPTGVCLDAASIDCNVVDLRIDHVGAVNAIAALDDGRVLFIEGGVRVRVIANDALVPGPALTTADSGTEFRGLAIDPSFSSSRFVYVAETELTGNGMRALNVVRYRELQGTLGEAAVILSGLPYPSGGEPSIALTLDAANHLYIGIPEIGGNGPDIYSGMVLEFNTDGTVPSDNRAASPILAQGYLNPEALRWDGVRNELWMVGSDTGRNTSIGRIQLGRDSVEWPRVPRVDPAFSAVVRGETFLVIRQRSSGELAPVALPATFELLDGGSVDAATDSHGALYLAVRASNSESTPRSQIVRLRRP
jgi:hypothetical protein